MNNNCISTWTGKDKGKEKQLNSKYRHNFAQHETATQSTRSDQWSYHGYWQKQEVRFYKWQAGRRWVPLLLTIGNTMQYNASVKVEQVANPDRQVAMSDRELIELSLRLAHLCVWSEYKKYFRLLLLARYFSSIPTKLSNSRKWIYHSRDVFIRNFPR